MTLSTSGLPVSYIATSRSRSATSARLQPRPQIHGAVLLATSSSATALVQLGLLGGEPGADRCLAVRRSPRPRR